MRVLLVYESISPIGGGSQLITLHWFKNLKKLGVKTKLLCNKPKDLAFLKEFDRKDFIFNKGIDLNMIIPHLTLSLFLTKESLKSIEEFNPQIIHFNDSLIFPFLLRKLVKKLKIKTISTFYTNVDKFTVSKFPLSLFFKEGKLVTRLLYKLYLKRLLNSDCLTVLSGYYKKKILKEFPKAKVFHTPPPISEKFFLKKIDIKKKTRPSKLITISRLSGEKKIDFLFSVLPLVKERFSLTIVGEGVDRKYLEGKVDDLGLNSYVKFAGWIPNQNLPKILKQHDLFISASDFETFGLVYVEALALGLPCFVYDYPVSREVIPNSTAIFIKNHHPSEWAKKLLVLRQNQQTFTKLLRNIKEKYNEILKYHELNSTKILLKIYRKILKSGL